MAKMKDGFYVIGLIILIISVILSLNFFLLIIGIPLYLIGSGLILYSKQKGITILISILTPLILYVMIVYQWFINLAKSIY